MGVLESAARKRRRKQDIQNAVLATVAVTGVIALAAVAPKTLQLLKYLPGDRFKYDYRARTAAGRLVKKGYAEWVDENGKKFLRITDKGRQQLAIDQEKAKLIAGKKPRWDGRWRMVVFDIPERRRAIRTRLCSIMREIGFVRMQDSVWVYPYDCEDFIALLKAELKIGKDVLYAIADTIEYDKPLRLHFSLPEE